MFTRAPMQKRRNAAPPDYDIAVALAAGTGMQDRPLPWRRGGHRRRFGAHLDDGETFTSERVGVVRDDDVVHAEREGSRRQRGFLGEDDLEANLVEDPVSGVVDKL